MINHIAAACLTFAIGPNCNVDRVSVCQIRDDIVVCAEGPPVRLMTAEEAHIRRIGGPSTVADRVRYRAR